MDERPSLSCLTIFSKGMAAAGKKAGRTASEGVIASYVHTGNRCAAARSL